MRKSVRGMKRLIIWIFFLVMGHWLRAADLADNGLSFVANSQAFVSSVIYGDLGYHSYVPIVWIVRM